MHAGSFSLFLYSYTPLYLLPTFLSLFISAHNACREVIFSKAFSLDYTGLSGRNWFEDFIFLPHPWKHNA